MAVQSGLQPVKLPVVRGFAIQIRPSEWEELRAAGIVARARMKVDFSSTHRRFVLCAEESGERLRTSGIIADSSPCRRSNILRQTGHAGDAQHGPCRRVSRIPGVGRDASIRYDVHPQHLSALADHLPRPGRTPGASSKVALFCQQGRLSRPLWQDGKTAQVGAYIPAFHRRTGDPLLIPPALHEAVGALTDAVCCVGCRKSHFLALKPVRLPEELSAPIIHKPSARATVPRTVPAVTLPTAQAGKNKKKRDRRKAKQRLARQGAADAALPKTPDAVADKSEVPASQEVTP